MPVGVPLPFHDIPVNVLCIRIIAGNHLSDFIVIRQPAQVPRYCVNKMIAYYFTIGFGIHDPAFFFNITLIIYCVIFAVR